MKLFFNITLKCLLSLICSCLVLADVPLSDKEFESVLSCYKTDIDSQATGTDKFKTAMAQFNKDLIYKLFIDEKRLKHPFPDELETAKDKPWLLFDILEKGYYQSMSEAFLQLPQFIGNKLSLKDIVSLHDLAVMHVKDMEKGLRIASYRYKIKAQGKEEALKELFFDKVLYHPAVLINMLINSKRPQIPIGTMDLRTLMPDDYPYNWKDLFSQIFAKEKNKYLSQAETYYHPNNFIIGVNRSKEELEQKLIPIFEHYYESLKKNNSLHGVVSAIAELLRTLEVSHFLPDGNTRTYASLLLTKLLIENGLPPAILDEPGMFRLVEPVNDIAGKIINGIRNFLNEFADNNRLYLSNKGGHCDDAFITRGKNKIFYALKNVQGIEKEVAHIEKAIMEHIKYYLENLPDNSQESEHTKSLKSSSMLNLAILIKSDELINKLVDKGASIWPTAWRIQQYPVYYALKIHDAALAKKWILEASDEQLKNIGKELYDIFSSALALYHERSDDVDQIVQKISKIWAKQPRLIKAQINELVRYVNINTTAKSERKKALDDIFGRDWSLDGT